MKERILARLPGFHEPPDLPASLAELPGCDEATRFRRLTPHAYENAAVKRFGGN